MTRFGRSVAGKYLVTVTSGDSTTAYGPMVSDAQRCQRDAQRLYGPTALASPWRKTTVVMKRVAMANDKARRETPYR